MQDGAEHRDLHRPCKVQLSASAPAKAATNTKVATKVGDQDRTEFEIRADAAFTECLDGLKPIQEA